MYRRYPVILLLIAMILLPPSAAAAVKTGAEVLRDSGFSELKGIRYGLITNQTAVVNGIHLLDLLTEAHVPPTVIFVPEHGLKGTEEDGVRIHDAQERGIPVRSLYGGIKKPKTEDLAGLNLLIFDIQDIGARFYTYISTLGLVMQEAAEAGVPLLVLDRPNPLGGEYVAGFVSRLSPPPFTALYPIPVAHGMTVGELAQMIKGENLLPGLKDLRLCVVPMSGWERWMRWPDTGLPWTPTSPNIPIFETALLYPGMGLLEGTGASEGRGTEQPFHLAGLPKIDAVQMVKDLNGQGLSGVTFAANRFTPQRLPGKASDPKYRGREVYGISVTVTDYRSLLPVETGVAVIQALYHAVPEKERRAFFRPGLTELAGTGQLRQAVEQGRTLKEITDLWHDEVQQFRARRTPYLLY